MSLSWLPMRRYTLQFANGYLHNSRFTNTFYKLSYNANTLSILHSSTRLFSTEKPDIPEKPEPNQQPTTLLDRTRIFFKKYGKVGLGVYLLVSSSTFITIYSLIHAGVDVAKLIEWLGLPVPKWSEKASTLIIAYTIYKILLPIRLMVSAALTPPIMKYLKRINWIK